MNSKLSAKYIGAAMMGLKFLHTLIVTLFFYAAWDVMFAHQIKVPFYGRGNYVIFAIFALIFVSFTKMYGGFSLGILQVSEIIYSNVVALCISNTILYAIIVLLARRFVNPFGICWAFVCQVLWCCVWVINSQKVYFSLFTPKKSCIVYGNEASRDSLLDLDKNRYNILSVLDIENEQDVVDLKKIITKIDCIFLCGITSQTRNEIVKYCIQHNIIVYVRPHISDLIISGAKRIQMCSVPVLRCERSACSNWYLAIKRAIDICVSLVALIILSPIILITAISVKLYDKGPVLYRQKRLTLNGTQFDVLKFRSMGISAEKDGVARLASKNDDRITPVGKIIRAIRLDELPQLWNILRGEMTIVGPRPERPEIAQQYEEDIPEFSMRLQVKAGLTGYAQVYGKYNTTPYDKLQMDLMYVANMGFVEDFRIMLATLKILFMPESTEGVEKSQSTAAVVSKEKAQSISPSAR